MLGILQGFLIDFGHCYCYACFAVELMALRKRVEQFVRVGGSLLIGLRPCSCYFYVLFALLYCVILVVMLMLF